MFRKRSSWFTTEICSLLMAAVLLSGCGGPAVTVNYGTEDIDEEVEAASEASSEMHSASKSSENRPKASEQESAEEAADAGEASGSGSNDSEDSSIEVPGQEQEGQTEGTDPKKNVLITASPDKSEGTDSGSAKDADQGQSASGHVKFKDSGLTDAPIVWTDANLGTAVGKALGKSSSEIMLSDLYDAKELQLNDASITSIADLAVCYNLEKLNVNSNQIANLNALSSMVNLEIFQGRNNNYSDLTPLAQLPALDRVDISSTPSRSNLLILAGNSHITRFTLYNMNLDNTSLDAFVSALVSGGSTVKKLDISGNPQISDYSPVSMLTDLEEFYAEYNVITDDNLWSLTTYLSGLPKLKEVTLQQNSFTDVTPLTMLKYVTYLNIANCPVSDITVLVEGMPSLTSIAMTGTPADTTPAVNAGIKLSQTVTYQS